MKQLEFEANIREVTKKVLLIENSLPEDVFIEEKEISINSSSVFVSSRFPLHLRANQDFGLEIAFRPLIDMQNQEVLLTINSSKLGVFKYQLILTSKRVTNIPSLNFKAKIGDSAVNVFSFINYLNKPAPYQVLIKNLQETGQQNKQVDFVSTINSVQTTSFQDRPENQVEIKFEPSYIGTSKSLLQLSNPEGGVYEVYLIGHSQPPLPKGPFKIGAKGYAIEFKNPFF